MDELDFSCTISASKAEVVEACNGRAKVLGAVNANLKAVQTRIGRVRSEWFEEPKEELQALCERCSILNRFNSRGP